MVVRIMERDDHAHILMYEFAYTTHSTTVCIITVYKYTPRRTLLCVQQYIPTQQKRVHTQQ